MNIRMAVTTAVAAVGAIVALGAAQQDPPARSQQRATIVVYKSPT